MKFMKFLKFTFAKVEIKAQLALMKNQNSPAFEKQCLHKKNDIVHKEKLYIHMVYMDMFDHSFLRVMMALGLF